MEIIVENYEQRATHERGELPRAVEILTGARTADAVFVVDPDYRIVHWDSRAESLTELLAQALFEQEERSCPRPQGRPCAHAEAAGGSGAVGRGQVGRGDRQGALPLADHGQKPHPLVVAGLGGPFAARGPV